MDDVEHDAGLVYSRCGAFALLLTPTHGTDADGAKRLIREVAGVLYDHFREAAVAVRCPAEVLALNLGGASAQTPCIIRPSSNVKPVGELPLALTRPAGGGATHATPRVREGDRLVPVVA